MAAGEPDAAGRCSTGQRSAEKRGAEGVIRFACELAPPRAPPPAGIARSLAAWHRILRSLHLLGRDARRYRGFAFGNLSLRHGDGFYITASGTGGAQRLAAAHCVYVAECRPQRLHLRAEGELPPSSESLTHGAAYAADDAIGAVFHAHSPDIFRLAGQLPHTAAAIEYGTPAMAHAVAALLGRHRQRPLAFATLGHEDGVFACAGSAAQAGAALVGALAEALALPEPRP